MSSRRLSAAAHPVFAEFPAHKLITASGVAIFHLKTARVVLCYHTRDNYWFLPKGRRDAGESSTRAAEREGFEESGYRNRLLPLPIQHRQPRPHEEAESAYDANVIESIWTSFLPMSHNRQYVLHWYIAETLPPTLEMSIGPPSPSKPYQAPELYPEDLSLRARMAMEPAGYEPPHYEGTGVDEEEACYRSELIPIEEAVLKLGRNSMAEVVMMGWDRIQARLSTEAGSAAT